MYLQNNPFSDFRRGLGGSIEQKFVMQWAKKYLLKSLHPRLETHSHIQVSTLAPTKIYLALAEGQQH